MVTSTFFNNYNNWAEQSLLEDLIVESIKIYGTDIYYMPRRNVNVDGVMREPEYYVLEDYAMLEAYIKNTQGFEGEGDFMSKFGLEIREELTLSVARRSWEQDVGKQFDYVRPREGDVIYLPMTHDLFSIRFVEDKSVFYQLGALQMWDLYLEKFEYSNEVFNTGVPDIDDRGNAFRTDVLLNLVTENALYKITTEAGDLIDLNEIEESIDVLDLGAQNDEFQTDGNNILDFTERDPFSEGGIY